ANAVYQSEYLLLTDRIREQARSHSFVCISRPESSFVWRQKISGQIPNESFTRHSSFFFVVAPLFLNGSGTKLSPLFNSP
ncbi:hypothetical protein, partial [Pseudomonas sp. 1152_12]|uniref:hypothetical protein n=1 Tax=Pseudomonas sp. 1152_12 TaxID=2604455 RepID=UPI0040635885